LHQLVYIAVANRTGIMTSRLLVQQLRLALKPPGESEGAESGGENDEKRLHV